MAKCVIPHHWCKKESNFINFEKKISGLSRDTRSFGPQKSIDLIKMNYVQVKRLTNKKHHQDNFKCSVHFFRSPCTSQTYFEQTISHGNCTKTAPHPSPQPLICVLYVVLREKKASKKKLPGGGQIFLPFMFKIRRGQGVSIVCPPSPGCDSPPWIVHMNL